MRPRYPTWRRGPYAASPGSTGARARNLASRRHIALLVVGIVALAFNLRAAITSLPPVFPELSASLRLSSAALAVLASVPVLCFRAVSAAAAAVAWLPQRKYRTMPPGPADAPLDAAPLDAAPLDAAPLDAAPLDAAPLGGGSQPGRAGQLRVYRYALAWQVTVFLGLQSLTFYATLSWLPTMFRDRGATAVHAGTLLALMNLGGAVTALATPVLAHRVPRQRGLMVAAIAASPAGLAGVWFAPLAQSTAWILVLGLGQGAALILAIYFPLAPSPDPLVAASLSAFAQGTGYLLATAVPLP